MEYNDESLIEVAVKRLSKNSLDFFTNQEYSLLKSESKGEWFKSKRMDSKLCSICRGKTCTINFESIDRFVPCPYGENQIINISDQDRISYKFDFDKFLRGIQSQLEINHDVETYEGFYLLGNVEIDNDNWQIVFSFRKRISLGKILGLKYKYSSPFTLVIIDNAEFDDSFDMATLSTFGVFLIVWKDPPLEYLRLKYANNSGQLLALKELSQNPELYKLLNEQLDRTATEGKGTPFEKAVFGAIEKLFSIVLPFGGNLSGFSIPDGLIMDATGDRPYPTLFYDCKSFDGMSFKHSAGIPMQANYYHDFLSPFYSLRSYSRTGFIIFASSFPDNVKAQIYGSPQWKYVFENFKIFFINISFLQRANKLISKFRLQSDQINKADFMRFCFQEEISVLQDSEVETYFKRNYDKSAFENYRFIDEVIAELGLISSVINSAKDFSFLSGVETDLKDVIKKAKHDNQSKDVKRPLISSYLREFVNRAKDNSITDILHPLSILLTLNRFEDDLRLQLPNFENLYDQMKEVIQT
ncbi:hypothetical protein [Cohnella abietis]|uniref:Restriction endonuclease n=1 Tax=Cohnella abietis TaxID=2507935 RepID=A0A3T1CZ78_9BACL|nr:hypothetical protein [Cohnella abietis]BBI31146.1 hypothetical protein KCTCHS21_05450 [Cohnella abietis]